jgi:predicted nucleotidyltransferase
MGILTKAYNIKKRKNLKVRKEALAEVNKIAKILAANFGAKEVLLYGSLSRPDAWFDAGSDIDLAVKGLGENYFQAYGYCLRLSRYPLDLKAYEDMPAAFKSKVNKEGRSVCLQVKPKKK